MSTKGTPFSTESLNPPVRVRDAKDLRFAEALFNLVDDIIFFVKDADLRYVLVNQTIVGRCGVESKEQIIGKTSAETFPEPLGDLFTKQDQKVLDTGVAIDGQIELHVYLDGSKGWCLTHKLPLFDESGSVVGLVGLSRDLHEPGQKREELGRAGQAVSRISNDYSSPLRVADLAKECGLTVSRLERTISKVYGMTPVQLLAKTRLTAATRLLDTTTDSITDIAVACGYSDHSAFTNKFRSSVGITPREYRSRENRNANG